ncbi:methyltransferase [Balneola sp. MJW-20]|uniref:methyltransferase n=1 Tax=Gracilimonas aurantiaca TaxID=3234185 RepID=UPI0034651EC2
MNQETTIQDTKIGRSFGEKAGVYHQKAEIQRKVANGLIASLKPWKEIVPSGPILEIGCGTGVLSELLVPEFKDRDFLFTDLSERMLEQCEKNLEKAGLKTDKISFQTYDVNQAELDSQYSLIISNFAVQWFDDAALGLEKLTAHLKPGGLLLSSFPGEKSFPEWYQKCLELGLPYTANELPNVEKVGIHLSMGSLQIDFFENEIKQQFDSSMDFFRHLKELGASESLNDKHLRPDQFRLLTRHWDQSLNKPEITWHIVYLAAKKDG